MNISQNLNCLALPLCDRDWAGDSNTMHHTKYQLMFAHVFAWFAGFAHASREFRAEPRNREAQATAGSSAKVVVRHWDSQSSAVVH